MHRLHPSFIGPGGEIGRRSRLKICRPKGRTGSIPVLGTRHQPLADSCSRERIHSYRTDTGQCRAEWVPDFLPSAGDAEAATPRGMTLGWLLAQGCNVKFLAADGDARPQRYARLQQSGVQVIADNGFVDCYRDWLGETGRYIGTGQKGGAALHFARAKFA